MAWTCTMENPFTHEDAQKMDAQKMFDMSKNDGKWDASWALLALLPFLFGSKPNNGEAEYWRGAYEALKEQLEGKEK